MIDLILSAFVLAVFAAGIWSGYKLRKFVERSK